MTRTTTITRTVLSSALSRRLGEKVSRIAIRNFNQPYTNASPSIYPKLFEAKDSKSFTFAQIAEQIKRPENWITSLFYGKIQPESKDLSALSKVLGIPLEDLTSSFQPHISSLSLPDVITRILQREPCPETLLTINGWVKTIRKQKHICFLELIDGSGPHHLQVVLSPEQSQGIETGSSITVKGYLVNSKGHGQGKEIKTDSVILLGDCPVDEYPLQKKHHSNAFLRQHLHLRPRTSLTSSVLRLRSRMAEEAEKYLRSHDFFRTETPVISFSDCEGAGEVFRIRADDQDQRSQVISTPSVTTDQHTHRHHVKEFFGQPAYLTVSSQLHLEALIAGLGRVYTLGPAFRAERSQTHRHMAEFWMLEAELSFCDNLEELMSLVEALLRSIIGSLNEELRIVQKYLDDGSTPGMILSKSLAQPWPRITYTEAIELIRTHHQQLRATSTQTSDQSLDLQWGQSIGSDDEKWLAGSYFQSPVFVTDYPTDQKPFYMLTNDDGDRSTVSCFDLLVPSIGELVGGSLREWDEGKLLRRMNERGMVRSQYDWYLELRRYGTVPHGGFGIGWDRLVCWITGLENVREAIGFPRVTGSGIGNC